MIVILSGDQGYADLSFNPHHPKEVATPHLDALARAGVFAAQPARVAELTKLHDAWIEQMAEPLHGPGKLFPGAAGKARKMSKEAKRKARADERAK